MPCDSSSERWTYPIPRLHPEFSTGSTPSEGGHSTSPNVYRDGESEQAVGKWLHARNSPDGIVVYAKGCHPPNCRPEFVSSELDGGRPRKPTVDEARSEALERLVPKAIRVLEEHLDSGRADAWLPALRVLEHGWGKPPEQIESEPAVEDGDLNLEKMSTAELEAFVRERRSERASADVLALVGSAER